MDGYTLCRNAAAQPQLCAPGTGISRRRGDITVALPRHYPQTLSDEVERIGVVTDPTQCD